MNIQKFIIRMPANVALKGAWVCNRSLGKDLVWETTSASSALALFEEKNKMKDVTPADSEILNMFSEICLIGIVIFMAFSLLSAVLGVGLTTTTVKIIALYTIVWWLGLMVYNKAFAYLYEVIFFRNYRKLVKKMFISNYELKVCYNGKRNRIISIFRDGTCVKRYSLINAWITGWSSIAAKEPVNEFIPSLSTREIKRLVRDFETMQKLK